MAIDKRIQEVFGLDPIVPYDEVELKHILTLMDKVPIYFEKLTELTARVQEFAKIAQPLTFNAHLVIDKMIFHAFFIELENRKFADFQDDDIHRHMSHVRANIEIEGIINSRNLSCEVCGETRSTDRCHIIPNKLGGTAETNNVLILCPTHHRLFDAFMLSRGEYVSINWERKSEPSQHYAHNVTLPAHMRFWDGLRSGDFRRVPQYDREFIPFIKHTLSLILNLFADNKFIKRSNIYRVMDANLLALSKKIVSFLVKNGILMQQESGADKYLFMGKFDPKSIDEIALHIWQTL